MRKQLFFLLLILPSLPLLAQYNFGFENYKSGTDTLTDWYIKDNQQAMGGLFRIDTLIKHSGQHALSIERNTDNSNNKFTPASILIPAQYAGKKLTVNCWLKTENIENYGQMWLRIDDPMGTILQLTNYPTGLKGNTDWKEYSVTIDLPEEADKIYLGFLIVGKGKIWGDDFNLLIDGKPLQEVAIKEKPKFKALQDNTEFVKGSGININNVTSFQMESLSLLGKIWGFLKYYHPYIANGNLNWDYELFRFLPQYLTITTKAERNTTLWKWINKWEKPTTCKRCNDKDLKEATIRPDLDWIADKNQLNDSLITTLNYIRENRHQGKQFYMDLHQGIRNPNVKHEAPYSQFAYPDAGYRLLSLFRYWNVIQYWFPNRHLTEQDWKTVLTEFIPKMITARNTTEYLLVTQQLIGSIHDTHANIWSTHKELEEWKGKYYPPVTLTFVDDMPVIRKIMVPELAQKSNLQIGDVIQSINGKPIRGIIKERLPNIPASNYATQLRDLSSLLLRSKDSLSNVTLLRNNQVVQTTIINTIPKNIWDWYQYDFPYQKDSSFFFIQPDVGYINLGKIKIGQVDSVFNTLKNSKGLIIDNRQYPGEFILYFIAAKLLPDRVPFALVPVGQLDFPGAFMKKDPLLAGIKNNNSYYKGKVIILINEATQSSGEFHSMAFRLAPDATVVGSTTAGADGNVSRLSLPGGISTMFSGIGILNPDGSETQRVGILPDIEVKRTVNGIKAGRDELMEKAIELITGKEMMIQPVKRTY